MPRFWNIHHVHVQPAGGDGPAVAPGESYEFTDEEAESIGVEWLNRDPRSGLAAEREWKSKRDASVATDTAKEPEETGDKKKEQPK